ncbi:hypothetical protein RclHR1_22800001 [Rhizophagus clarus]|uniref:Ribonuclease H-like domain-containing protein n=1 Tax=Rhizophagus clarus TaxID=94130 RepID=A0A2Z6RAR9_9GLOM|nr:hypothetical protein RclHR1_22800001 [Rhizophagus clarus]GES87621.1 ribonuclease H-like domain-containing protein [Rhizophagus clarus]
MIDPNSTHVLMTARFIQTRENTQYEQFTTSLFNWPSAFRAESMAILLVLIVSPDNCNITIHTDSQSVISKFNNFLESDQRLTPRSIFNISSSTLIWTYIYNYYLTKHLKVQLNKVQAHSTNYRNNVIDHLVRAAHNLENQHLSFRSVAPAFLTIFPVWNGVPVEHRLRHFLKIFTDCKNFETLYNLNCNTKYRQHNISIDWRRTLSLLSSSSFANNTTFFAQIFQDQTVYE